MSDATLYANAGGAAASRGARPPRPREDDAIAPPERSSAPPLFTYTSPPTPPTPPTPLPLHLSSYTSPPTQKFSHPVSLRLIPPPPRLRENDAIAPPERDRSSTPTLETSFNLGNEVYYMNSLTLLVKIMLCSKLQCQKVLN